MIITETNNTPLDISHFCHYIIQVGKTELTFGGALPVSTEDSVVGFCICDYLTATPSNSQVVIFMAGLMGGCGNCLTSLPQYSC